MSIEEILGDKREEILQIARNNGVIGIRVFGSVARGDASPDSDVDFLLDVGEHTPPWFPGGLVSQLEEVLGMRVDVVEEASLRPETRERVLKEAVPL